MIFNAADKYLLILLICLDKKKVKERVSKNPNIRPHDSKPSSIQSMFAAAATKPRKEAQVCEIKLCKKFHTFWLNE